MDGSFCIKPLKQKQVVSTYLPMYLPALQVILFYLLLCRPEENLYHSLSHFLPQVDGVSYLLQEIYGIENKYNSQESKVIQWFYC